MYRKTQKDLQLQFEFAMPFGGEMDRNNRWVHKREYFPWEYIEELYIPTLSGSDKGSPAAPSSVAFGAIYIQEFLGLTDRETVAQIQENPYMQYFLGNTAYSPAEPFDHSLLVTFRKRFSEELLAKINERIAAEALGLAIEDDADDADADDADSNAPSEKPPEEDTRSFEEKAAENHGKLIMDATCTPADIPYPTDVNLLNESREKSEEIIDILHAPFIGIHRKPRTYRQRARKAYLAFAKQRKPNKKKIRKTVRQQLGYLRRNLATIAHMAGSTDSGGLSLLSRHHYKLLLVINEVYRQQQYMYENAINKTNHRIVNIYQPHVRPIVRGKAGKAVEFGAKLSISLVDGYSFVDRLNWEAYNESGDVPERIECYKKRHGHYPEAVQADTIYRTRKNRKYCAARGIRLSGPPLGRPRKETEANKEILKTLKQQQRQDERDRQAVEGKFGQAKRRFRLDHIMTKLAITSGATIMMAFIVMNIEKVYRDLLFVLFLCRHEPVRCVWNVLKGLVSGEKLWTEELGGLHLRSQLADQVA